MRRLVLTGVAATVAAMAATAAGAALARAAGVDLEVTDGEAIPVSGIAFVTGVCSVVGIALAAALLRWSSHPTERFMTTTVALTALSLVPPVLVGADAATAVTLVALHLTAAAVMIPTLARALRTTASAGRSPRSPDRSAQQAPSPR